MKQVKILYIDRPEYCIPLGNHLRSRGIEAVIINVPCREEAREILEEDNFDLVIINPTEIATSGNITPEMEDQFGIEIIELICSQDDHPPIVATLVSKDQVEKYIDIGASAEHKKLADTAEDLADTIARLLNQ